MYLLVIFFSIVGSCLAGLFGKHLGSWGSAIITTSCLFLSFVLSIFVFYEVALVGCCTYVKLAVWISSEVLHVDWGFMFDSLTASMCVVVTFISFLVHFYSIEYMSHDPHLPRFMSYLSLFTFFMLILITADNFLQMFVGWEGVGLCSYLLINFWFTRIQANKAAIKAMVLNRIGDFSLLISIFLIFINYKALDYATIAAVTPLFQTSTVYFLNFKVEALVVISLFMFIGATGKSAQLILHTWLADAMEGPTPVSALIHAATMVTAGVFLITRCSMLFEYVDDVLKYIAIVGSMTSFFAATTGLLQNDLKRVIANSTTSQLGYMIFACGLSNYTVGFFHLTNHAFFKALLFLSAGSVIHAVNDEQDMRKMGGLKHLVPFTYSMVVVGSLALIGFPFLAGFYSKDLVLEVAFGKYSLSGHFSYHLGTIGAFFTAFYSMRLCYLTFLAKPMGHKRIICFVFDSGFKICLVLVCLAIPSIVIGYYIKDMLRVNSLQKGWWRGTEKEALCLLKASAYSRFLDFNFGGFLTQECLDFLQFSLSSNMCGEDSLRLIILSWVCNVDISMLSNEVDWKKPLLVVCESRKGLYFSRYRPRGGLDMKFSRILDVSPVLINLNSLKYENCTKCLFSINRYFSLVPSQLKKNFNKKLRKFENVFPIICSIENLQEAWYEIKSKSGNAKSGGDPMKISNDLELKWFEKTFKKLLSGSYKYKFVRRVYINKSGEDCKSSLVISSPREKIVQRAFFRVLQFIYEGVSVWKLVDFKTYSEFVDPNKHSCESFLKRTRTVKGFKVYEIRNWIIEPRLSHLSFGFRLGRSVQSALKFIKRTWSPVWFWSADLVKAFDKVNHNKLINEINKTLKDSRFTDNLYKMMRLETFSLKVSDYVKGAGISQENALSPLLFNIYLSSFDSCMESLQVKYDKEVSMSDNSEYQKRIKVEHRKFVNMSFKDRTQTAKFEKGKAFAKSIEAPTLVNKPIKIYYVRYAADMLFGFNMEKHLAKKVINRICILLKSDLHLDCQKDIAKSKLIHGISELINFLGFNIGL